MKNILVNLENHSRFVPTENDTNIYRLCQHLKEREPESAAILMEDYIIIEDFEAIFTGLVGVYSRLAFKERFRKPQPDDMLYQQYQNRANELFKLKKLLILKPILKIKEYNEEYRPELLRMEQLEREFDNAHQ